MQELRQKIRRLDCDRSILKVDVRASLSVRPMKRRRMVQECSHRSTAVVAVAFAVSVVGFGQGITMAYLLVREDTVE